ncbi:RFX DNA-binding domain-containing protein [Pilobolus umbonatus]|nr:RFX DNA-binding domain-containing protein [Pilobolus umbonatus]
MTSNTEDKGDYPRQGTIMDNIDLLDPSIITDREASLHVTRWVRDNYVQERDHNVPRMNMFEHYKTHCIAHHLTPVNSATFGKLLRIVFPELKTRRLGVRGQSKYHYCGIRVRALNDKRDTSIEASTSDNIEDTRSTPYPLTTHHSYISASSSSTSRGDNIIGENISFPSFITPKVSYGYNYETDNIITSFTGHYERHCREILNFVSKGQIDQVHQCMGNFYENMPEQFKQLLRTVPDVTEAVWRWDSTLYDNIITGCLPTIATQISPDMVRMMKKYTRELKGYIDRYVGSYPPHFYQTKSDVARIFTAKFRRHIYLNSAAQAANALLVDDQQSTTMRNEWNKLDIDGLTDQSLWVCECETEDIRGLLKYDVNNLLLQQNGIEHWMCWLSRIVNKYLEKHNPATPNDTNHYISEAKQFILKWSFYTSLIMRQATLQNMESLTHFHTLSIFLDDYILYRVEESIAKINYAFIQQQSQSQPQESHIFTPPSSSSGSKYHEENSK